MQDIDSNTAAEDDSASADTEPIVLRKKIDRTTYEVNIYFSKTSTETMGDKLARIIGNEVTEGLRKPLGASETDTQQTCRDAPPTAGKKEK
jgi:hypothetical protein